MSVHTTQRRREGRRVPWPLIVCLVAGAATFFLWAKHESHFVRAVPYALLLLCPFMHLLLHRSHGGRDESQLGRHDHA